MLFALVLAGTVLSSPPLPQADRAVLSRVDRAVSRLLDGGVSPARFATLVGPAEARTCARLQSRVAANSPEYVTLSFVQAYYGVNYPASLDGVLRPYRRWSRSVHRSAKEVPLARSAPRTDVDSTPLMLYQLYRRRHDARILGLILDLDLDGGPAELCDDVLGKLWAHQRRGILRVCDRHPDRIETLTGALMFDYVLTDGEASPYASSKKRFASTLRSLVDASDPRVSRPARALRTRILDNTFWAQP